MIRSDPDWIVGRNRDLILEKGFDLFMSQTHFAEALLERIPSCDPELFWSLYDSYDNQPFKRRCIFYDPDKLWHPSQLQLQKAFVSRAARQIMHLIVRNDVDLLVEDGYGRFPFNRKLSNSITSDVFVANR
jgi:hypothetical protein